MAIRDITKKPFIQDRDENIFVGIDYPFHRSDGIEGWFASTDTTIKSVKNNVKMLLSTTRGERLLQPSLGINFQRFLFEPFTSNTRIEIENEIVDTFSTWLPFVEIQDIQIDVAGEDTIGRAKIKVSITFNITKDPNSLESVSVVVGE